MEKNKLKWKSKNIYWHKVIFIDLERIKKYKLMKRPYKQGQLVGFGRIEKSYQTLDNKTKDLVPYVIFKYLGKTKYSDNYKERQKYFKEFQDKLKSLEVNSK